MKPIIVVVEGGIVQEIFFDEKQKILVIDYDSAMNPGSVRVGKLAAYVYEMKCKPTVELDREVRQLIDKASAKREIDTQFSSLEF